MVMWIESREGNKKNEKRRVCLNFKGAAMYILINIA